MACILRFARPTAIAIKEGQIRRCKDPVWWACEWQGPAKLTVDAGRTADSTLKLLKNLGLTYEDYWNERGKDARTQAVKQIEFLAWLMAQAKERGVPMAYLIEEMPGVQIAVARTDQQKPDDAK